MDRSGAVEKSAVYSQKSHTTYNIYIRRLFFVLIVNYFLLRNAS